MSKEEKEQSIFQKHKWLKPVSALVAISLIISIAVIGMSGTDSDDNSSTDTLTDDSSNSSTDNSTDTPPDVNTIPPEEALDEIMQELYSGDLHGLYDDTIYSVLNKPIPDPSGMMEYLIVDYTYEQIEMTLYYAHEKYDSNEDYEITYTLTDPDESLVFNNHKISEEELFKEINKATGMNVQGFREYGVERDFAGSLYIYMVQLDSHWYWWL